MESICVFFGYIFVCYIKFVVILSFSSVGSRARLSVKYFEVFWVTTSEPVNYRPSIYKVVEYWAQNSDEKIRILFQIISKVRPYLTLKGELWDIFGELVVEK